MAPPRRSRFLEDGDLEAKRAREEKRIEEYNLHPLDDSPDIAEATSVTHKGLIR
jgi:hypothetical protein